MQACSSTQVQWHPVVLGGCLSTAVRHLEAPWPMQAPWQTATSATCTTLPHPLPQH